MILLPSALAVAPAPLVTDWLSIILSSVAIIIGVVVAYHVWKQSLRFHRETRDHETETYSRERYDALVEVGMNILDSARQIQHVTSERWAHLVGMESVPSSPADDEGRSAASRLLASMENRAQSLVLTQSLLPQTADGHLGQSVRDAVEALRLEAAWLVGDAHLAIISFYGGPDYNEAITGTRPKIVDQLVGDSVCNISQRLIFGHVGHEAYIGQEGNNWQPAMRKRVESVLGDDRDAESPKEFSSTMSVESNWLLNVATERFATALFAVVDACEALRRPVPTGG